MDVSENSGIPKSSILIGFSIINHPFWGYPYVWKHPYLKLRLNGVKYDGYTPLEESSFSPPDAGSQVTVVTSLSNETRVPRWLFRVDRGLYDPVMCG